MKADISGNIIIEGSEANTVSHCQVRSDTGVYLYYCTQNESNKEIVQRYVVTQHDPPYILFHPHQLVHPSPKNRNFYASQPRWRRCSFCLALDRPAVPS